MAKTAEEATKGLHGKADDKRQPMAERLGHLEGKSTFTDPNNPRGTWIDITDPDVMAAVAMSRMGSRNEAGEFVSDQNDVGPEILETYYGTTARHRRRIAMAYIAQARKPDTKHGVSVQRAAALIAVQRLGGCQFSGEQWAELAWMAFCRTQEFTDQVNAATAWMEGERDRAREIFDDCFKTIQEQRQHERREYWQSRKADPSRSERIRKAVTR